MSPVSPDCPEPLKTALEDMERVVQSAKRSLAFAAPEVQDVHWARMQENLAEILAENVRVRTVMTKDEIVELCAEAVHDKWVETKLAQGVTSRPSEDGTEQIAPYATLPEHIKDLDRGSVRATVEVLVEHDLLAVEEERA